MKKTLATLVAATTLLSAGAAVAQVPEGNWLIRGRIVNIAPNESNGATGGGLIGEDSIKVDNRWAPEVDISYFFTRNFALELVLTYPQKHDVEWTGSALTTPPGGTLNIGSIKQLPPSLLAQYHFPLANGLKPYVGAGLTYFRITDNDLNVNGAKILDIRRSNWGPAVQLGVDYALTKNWYLNADVKYVWVETKVTDTVGLGIDTTLKVNPWVYGVGLGYRF